MLFSLLICTGLRISEAMRLRWTDINWDNTPMMVSIIGAKFDKDRAIPLADGLSQQPKKYREEMSLLFPACEYLFPSRHYVPYSQDQVYSTFCRILYDTGARVSEILLLKVRDVHLSNPAKVVLYGKGRKLREIPILPNTVLHLQQYVAEYGLSATENLDRTFFVNRQGNPLTRAGATYIIEQICSNAWRGHPCFTSCITAYKSDAFVGSRNQHLLHKRFSRP